MQNFIDQKISLEEPGHRYVLEEDPNFEFKSVTGVISNYFEPFVKHDVANRLVTTSPKYMGKDPNELIANWDAARDYGTKVHNEIELYLNENSKPEAIESFAAIKWLNTNAFTTTGAPFYFFETLLFVLWLPMVLYGQ